MAKIDAFFKLMHEQGASDLHLVAGQPPALRIRGEVERVKYKVLTSDDLRSMLYEITPEHKIKQFEETGRHRFRLRDPGPRPLPRQLLHAEVRLRGGLPRDPEQDHHRRGARAARGRLQAGHRCPGGWSWSPGPTGSGKSTTLAAIIDEANTHPEGPHHHDRGPDRIRPPEPELHRQPPRGRACTPRSFTAALRGALREDPDIILVGEMRDLETISLAVEAASTGHLVFAHPAHDERRQDRRPGHRGLPRERADADPLHPGRRHPGGHRPGPLQADRQEGALRRTGDPDRELRRCGT
ncbi:MAG: Flp pilus assembly complex ATPase component TadA [Desulfobacterales bacterium]|nr:Flp pilus assembly complex ATPase component TadA [Desulfobacterales bacterium]